MRLARTTAACVLVASAALGLAGGNASQTPAQSSATLEAARRRWERLSPEERDRARAAYERYRALSEEERRTLSERARHMQETRERVQRELPPDVREKLDKMDPEKRRALVRDLVESEARGIGQRIRDQMPENWRERIEKATPEDRGRFFEQFKRQQRERVARMALEQIGRRLQLPPEEARRLQELPLEERARAVLELRKRLSEKDAQEFGLPPGITREQWDEWQKLPPEEFFERVQRYRQSRGWHPDGPDEQVGPPGLKPPWAERIPPERREGLRRLLEAVAERRQDQIDFADLPRAEREARVLDRKRQRCLAVILESRLLPSDGVADLSRQGDHEFFEVVRHLLRPPPRDRPPGDRPTLPRERQSPPGPARRP